jgi:hypothetical protein
MFSQRRTIEAETPFIKSYAPGRVWEVESNLVECAREGMAHEE